MIARIRTNGVVLPVLLAAALVSPATRADDSARPAAAEVEMSDQLGGSGSVSQYRGEPVVVMVVTASRLRNLKGWQRDLQERFEDLRFVLVADIPAEPPVTLERVQEKLSTRVPEEVPVLIDLERQWATELELDTDRPNILVLDGSGELVARYHGRKEKVLVDEVCARLEELLGDEG
jgi:hypothetical protein